MMIPAFSQFQTNGVVVPAPGNIDFRSDVEQANPGYQVDDPDSADISTVLRIANEMIKVNGAAVQVHPRTDNYDINAAHDEDPDPTYWPPKSFRAFWVPQPIEVELQEWGADVSNQTAELVFSRSDVFGQLSNRLIRIGDIMEVRYGAIGMIQPKYFYVNNAQEFGNFRYQWLYVKCQCTLIIGEVNIRPVGDQVHSIDAPAFQFPDP